MVTWLARALFERGPDDVLVIDSSDSWGIASTMRERRPGEMLGRFVALAALSFAQFSAVRNNGGWMSPLGLTGGIISILCIAAWATWVLAWSVMPQKRGQYFALAGLLVMGACGALLTGLLNSTGVSPVFPAIASVIISARWPIGRAACVVGGFIAILLVSAACVSFHQFTGNGLGYGSLLAGMFGVGLGRRSYILRAESAEQLVKETERANTEEAHAAALAERSRIAREIHDVLAHSLAALTVQLEAADALLESGGEPAVAKAHDYVVKSRRIAREGLVETRRAIAALREDAPPLPELLSGLVDAYRDDSDASAYLRIEGLPRPLKADAGLTLYRAAQESLTNIRKHAPGSPVEVRLEFREGVTVLTVTNGSPTGPRSALADSGGGYGLAGLKERAELIGGSLDAGPSADLGEGGWRVRVTLAG